MNFDFNSLSQNQKFQLYAAGIMLISLFLPWWSSSFSANISAMGQSYGSSASNSLTGFQLTGGIIPIVVCIAAAYFVFNNPSYVLWCGVAGLLFSANSYFGIIPTGSGNVSLSYGDMGGVSAKSGFEYGLYLFAIAAGALTFFAYRENTAPAAPVAPQAEPVAPPAEQNNNPQ